MTRPGTYQTFTLPNAERFWSRVDRGTGDSCWRWNGARNKEGYGRVRCGARIQLAHRVAYRLQCGDIPDGALVLHRCDNKRCVRPDHLHLGDYAANMREASERGLIVRVPARGERCGRHKLTDADVRSIRARSATGISRTALAREFKVTSQQVGAIVLGKSWRHLLTNQAGA